MVKCKLVFGNAPKIFNVSIVRQRSLDSILLHEMGEDFLDMKTREGGRFKKNICLKIFMIKSSETNFPRGTHDTVLH